MLNLTEAGAAMDTVASATIPKSDATAERTIPINVRFIAKVGKINDDATPHNNDDKYNHAYVFPALEYLFIWQRERKACAFVELG